jgi:hypothetical protein
MICVFLLLCATSAVRQVAEESAARSKFLLFHGTGSSFAATSKKSAKAIWGKVNVGLTKTTLAPDIALPKGGMSQADFNRNFQKKVFYAADIKNVQLAKAAAYATPGFIIGFVFNTAGLKKIATTPKQFKKSFKLGYAKWLMKGSKEKTYPNGFDEYVLSPAAVARLTPCVMIRWVPFSCKSYFIDTANKNCTGVSKDDIKQLVYDDEDEDWCKARKLADVLK